MARRTSHISSTPKTLAVAGNSDDACPAQPLTPEQMQVQAKALMSFDATLKKQPTPAAISSLHALHAVPAQTKTSALAIRAAEDAPSGPAAVVSRFGAKPTKKSTP